MRPRFPPYSAVVIRAVLILAVLTTAPGCDRSLDIDERSDPEDAHAQVSPRTVSLPDSGRDSAAHVADSQRKTSMLAHEPLSAHKDSTSLYDENAPTLPGPLGSILDEGIVLIGDPLDAGAEAHPKSDTGIHEQHIGPTLNAEIDIGAPYPILPSRYEIGPERNADAQSWYYTDYEAAATVDLGEVRYAD